MPCGPAASLVSCLATILLAVAWRMTVPLESITTNENEGDSFVLQAAALPREDLVDALRQRERRERDDARAHALSEATTRFARAVKLLSTATARQNVDVVEVRLLAKLAQSTERLAFATLRLAAHASTGDATFDGDADTGEGAAWDAKSHSLCARAVHHWTNVVRLAPDAPRLHAAAVPCLRHLGRLREVVTAYETALTMLGLPHAARPSASAPPPWLVADAWLASDAKIAQSRDFHTIMEFTNNLGVAKQLLGRSCDAARVWWRGSMLCLNALEAIQSSNTAGTAASGASSVGSAHQSIADRSQHRAAAVAAACVEMVHDAGAALHQMATATTTKTAPGHAGASGTDAIKADSSADSGVDGEDDTRKEAAPAQARAAVMQLLQLFSKAAAMVPNDPSLLHRHALALMLASRSSTCGTGMCMGKIKSVGTGEHVAEERRFVSLALGALHRARALVEAHLDATSSLARATDSSSSSRAGEQHGSDDGSVGPAKELLAHVLHDLALAFKTAHLRGIQDAAVLTSMSASASAEDQGCDGDDWAQRAMPHRRFAEALEVLDQSIKLYPASPSSHNNRALVLIRLEGMYAAAMQQKKRRQRTQQQKLADLAREETGKGPELDEQGIEAAEKVGSMGAGDKWEENWAKEENSYEVVHDDDVPDLLIGEALDAWRLAIALSPADLKFHNNMAGVLLNAGRYDESQSILSAAIGHNLESEKWPESDDVDALAVLSNVAGVYRLQGRFHEAAATYERIVAVSPTHASARYLGRISARLAREKSIKNGKSSTKAEARQEASFGSWTNPDEDEGGDVVASEFMHVQDGSQAEVGKVDAASDIRSFNGGMSVSSPPLSLVPPLRYVQEEFDGFAEKFDDWLVGQLQYVGPQLVVSVFAEAAASLERKKQKKKMTKAEHQHMEDDKARRSFATRPWAVLDAGCGTGLVGPLLRQLLSKTAAGTSETTLGKQNEEKEEEPMRGDNVRSTLVGVDISFRMLAHAEARGIYDELLHADLITTLASWTATVHPHPREHPILPPVSQHIRHPDSPRDGTKLDNTGAVVDVAMGKAELDLIIAADVFVYIADLAPLFAASAAALRPGGLLVFTTEQDGRDADTTAPEPWIARRGATTSEEIAEQVRDGGCPQVSADRDSSSSSSSSDDDKATRGWSVLSSGRVAHRRAYVLGHAARHGFRCVVYKVHPLRLEGGSPVIGGIYALEKAARPQEEEGGREDGA